MLLIDMINAFTDAASPLGSESDAVVQACAKLQESFRERRLPVCFTTVAYSDDAQAAVFRARLPTLNMLVEGSAASTVDERLRPQGSEPVFAKHHASAFFGTGLDEWLKDQSVDSLVVVGLTTSGCVRASVVDGLQHDFVVWVPREAVGDRNSEAHAANLHDMHAKYAEVVSVADVVNALKGSS